MPVLVFLCVLVGVFAIVKLVQLYNDVADLESRYTQTVDKNERLFQEVQQLSDKLEREKHMKELYIEALEKRCRGESGD